MKAYIKPHTEAYDVALSGIIAESPFTVDTNPDHGVDAGESLVREEELDEEWEW